MKFEPEVEKALEEVSTQLIKQSPELATLIERAQKGEITLEEALQKSFQLTSNNKEVEKTCLEIFKQGTQTLREHIPEDGLIFQPETGLPRLHPLYEAALAERIQFDGDIPEKRTSKRPADSSPAVPVITDARNPVALGQMLLAASEHIKGAEALLPSENTSDSENNSLQARGEQNTPPQTSYLEEYQPGKLPTPIKIESGNLLQLPQEVRRKAAWTSIATTQGRRSQVQIIEDLVVEQLKGKGYQAYINNNKPENPNFQTTWKTQISMGNSIQPNFAFTDVAAAVFTSKVESFLKDSEQKTLKISIETINTYQDRQVGWCIKVV